MTVLIIFTVLTTTFIISSNVEVLSRKLNLQIADETAHHYASKVKLVLEKAMESSQLLEINFWQARQAKVDRQFLDKALIDTIRHDDNIFGTWMLWEPNAYDKQDDLFANSQGHDETGRVNSYWHWQGKDIINEPNQGWEKSTWYNNPRKRAKETLEQPYFYQVSDTKVLLISTIQPIVHDDVFYGVIGVDVDLASLQEIVNNLTVMGTGFSTLVANNGMYVAHPDKALIGQTVNEAEISSIQLGQYQQKFVYADAIEELSYQVSIPIFVGETATPWAFIVTIPLKKIVSSGDDISQTIFYISIISGLIMLITLLAFVERFIAPIAKITAQFKAAVKTNEGIIPYVQPSSKDEVGQLAETFNLMAYDVNNSHERLKLVNDEIFKLNAELEGRVKSRTLELERSLEQQQSMQSQLVESEKMASLGRLVAGVAHELNTPIGICVTANSLLLDDIIKLKQSVIDGDLTKNRIKQYYDSTIETGKLIEFNLYRASELIQNFKMVSVDVSSNSTYTFNLIEYIHKVLKSLHPVTSKTKHHIEIIEREEIEVTCDPGDISQIVTNIVMNAITHAFTATKPGNITIDVVRKNDDIHMEFKDNGVGMTNAIINNVFEPFFTTNRDNGGSGLGMHIVYNIVVQKLRGTIKCDSDVSEGACYTIIFPIKRE